MKLITYVLLYIQSLNVIESPKLRAIFLMLREDLKDSDIPHRTTIRQRIMEIWEEHLGTLSEEMQVRLFTIQTSFTDYVTEIDGKNLYDHGHVVGSKLVAVHGSNSTLD